MNVGEQKHAHYYPTGIPITPQARQFGYEFPVYVSQTVWDDQCVWNGPMRYNTHTEKRIIELLQHCYEGMCKKLAVQDDFVSYAFKIWYFDRTLPKRTGRKLPKKKRAQLGARLFLDPEEGTPWLYVFNPEEDSTDELKKGKSPNAVPEDGCGVESEVDPSASSPQKSIWPRTECTPK